jgi:hypothetical protein
LSCDLREAAVAILRFLHTGIHGACSAFNLSLAYDLAIRYAVRAARSRIERSLMRATRLTPL